MALPRARTFALVLVTATVLVGGGVVLLGSHIETRWQETLDWAEAEQERYESRDFRRPVLWGSARRGLATIHYREAAEFVAADNRLLDRVNGELHFREADASEQQSAVEVLAPALEALREGAHCADARRALDWDRGFTVPTPNLLACRGVMNLAMIRARLLLAEGEAIEAVRVLLDCAQLGRDYMEAPLLIDQIVGAAILAISVRQTADAQFVESLPEPALRELAAGLAILDENLPVQEPAVHVETVLFVRHYEGTRLGRLDEEGFGFPDSWRYAFSSRWMLAEAVEQLIAFGETRDRAGILPWPEAEKLLREAAESAKTDGNPIVSIAAPNIALAARTRRQVIARLRLLRTAVAHRLGEVLVLYDPLGDGPLRLIEDEEGAYFRSAGVSLDKPIQRPVPR